ncbi:MAG: type II secretion system protein [Clostridia bacterium]
MQKAHNKGFTLIEVLVVTVILTIVASLISVVTITIINVKQSTLTDTQTKNDLSIIENIISSKFYKYDNSTHYFSSDTDKNLKFYEFQTPPTPQIEAYAFVIEKLNGNITIKGNNGNKNPYDFEYTCGNKITNISFYTVVDSVNKGTLLKCVVKYIDTKGIERDYTFIISRKTTNPQ